MRPCFVTTSFAPTQHNSGISNALFLLTKYLHEKKEINSTVFAPIQRWGKSDQDLEYLSIRRFHTKNMFNFSYSTELLGKVEDEHKKEKFDLVHSFHYGFFPATAGHKFSRQHHLSHFLTAAFHPPASKFKRILMSTYNYTQGRSILSDSTVFPFNKNERNQLSAYSKFRSSIIPCPVNDDIFYPRKSKFSKLTVTFAGTFLPWKGPKIALDIFNKIGSDRSDINFILMGTGPLEHQLRKDAGRNTKVLSNLPAKKFSEVLSKSDLVVCPTLYESFGSAIAEAMMCGTPVVSTNVGAVPETVGPGGVLVDYGQWSQMKNSITNLLDDQSLRSRLAKSAIKHSNNYKYKNVCAKIYESYTTHVDTL